MDISKYAEKYQVKKRGTEIDDVINEFVKEINQERVGKHYLKNGKKVQLKPVTFMAVKMKLYAIRNKRQDLYEFLSECRDYKNRQGSFSKIFFGATK